MQGAPSIKGAASPPRVGDDAVEHWQALLARAPDHLPALMGLTKALAAVGRADEIVALANGLKETAPSVADKVLQAGVRALPLHPAIGLAACQSAEARGDQAEIQLRWTMLCRRQPDLRDGHAGLIQSLLRMRRQAAAELAIETALARFGEDAVWRELLAEIAEARKDWQNAALRWKMVGDIKPEHPQAQARQRAAEERVRQQQGNTLPLQPVVVPSAPIPKREAEQPGAIKALLMGFESIGADCEFGLLQRRYEAEPLGLLRFAGTLPRTILMLLKTRFAGIGDPEEMTISVAKREYRMRHLKSGWGMHTRIRPSPDNSEASVHKDQCRNATFLRKKLIRELEQQSKILVYQRHDLSDENIALIYQAVQEYGPNMLVCVRVATKAHPAGSIEWRTERLMVAAIDRAGMGGLGEGWDISVDYWIYFCRVARARWDALRAAA